MERIGWGKQFYLGDYYICVADVDPGLLSVQWHSPASRLPRKH